MEINESALIYEIARTKVTVFFVAAMFLSGFLADVYNNNFKWQVFWTIACVLSWIILFLCIFNVNEQFILFLGGMTI